MIGAIAGDIIGSPYEFRGIKTIDFPLFSEVSTFTDDTVLTIAVADCLVNGRDYTAALKEYGHRYPHAGYGGMFAAWLQSPVSAPYGSYGNGSAMRVSPVGFARNSLDEVMLEAERSSAVTHNHPEGIKGAQAIAAAIYLARTGKSKPEIRDYVQSTFGYDLNRTLDDIRPTYVFDETCQGSVPEAIIAFLDSVDYEDAVRKAISLGGDADTLACMAGGIAQAFYGGVPDHISQKVRETLTPDLLALMDSFNRRFKVV